MRANNENIIKALKSDDFPKEFPIYGDSIVRNIGKGELREYVCDQVDKKINLCSKIAFSLHSHNIKALENLQSYGFSSSLFN